MKTYISLLRGINVSGQKKIKMEDLRKLYESLGFKNVQSYIQSGNVLFQSDETRSTKLIQTIEQAIQKKYGYHVTVILKTPEDLKKALKENPFEIINESRLLLVFLAKKPSQPDMKPVEAITTGKEQVQLVGDVVYLSCPDGSGRSKLSNNLIEKKLDTPATSRNWRSTQKLLSMAEEMSSS